jgi:hypothetical protein
VAARTPDGCSAGSVNRAVGRAKDSGGSPPLTEADVKRFWANVAGEVIAGWELAVGWDDRDHPTDWRTLRPDNPEDQDLLRERGLIEG